MTSLAPSGWVRLTLAIFFSEMSRIAPVEPARRLARGIERAAREPGLRVARLAQIDPVIAGAEPIVAPFADDRLGEVATRFVFDRDQGRFSVAGVLDLEPRIEIGLLGLWLDQGQIRHRQHDLADLGGVRRIVALLGDEPAVPVADQGHGRAVARHA